MGLLQGAPNPPLYFAAGLVASLGSGAALLALAAFVYWCVDEKKGLRLGTALLVSAWLNIVLKFLLGQPDPATLSATLSAAFEGLAGIEGYGHSDHGLGLPSGYAQNTLVAWLIIASWGKARWRFVAAAVLSLLGAFSLMYLRRYFPTDILGGWLVGGALLCFYFLAHKRIEALLTDHAPRAGLIAAAALSFAMILYRPHAQMLMSAGLLLGAGVGFYLCKRYIGFTSLAPLSRVGFARYLTLFTRFAIGIAGLFLIDALLGIALNTLRETENFQLVVFLQFALYSLWISVGAPWVFRAVRLSESNVIHYQEYD